MRVVERGSYSLPGGDSLYPAYYWIHGIGEIVSALCSAGLHIEFLHEFPKVYEDFAAYLQAASGQVEKHIIHQWAVPNTFSIKAFPTKY